MKANIANWITLLIIVGGISPAFSAQQEITLTQSEINTLITNTANTLEQTYLFPEKGKQGAKALLTQLNKGTFRQAYPLGMFKRKFEATLINATSDTGFELKEKIYNNPLRSADVRNEVNSVNVKKMPGKIGVIEFTGDFIYSDGKSEITAALEYLADSTALIIDLRSVGGGTLPLATHLISFFIPPNTIIADVRFNPALPSSQIITEDKNTHQRFNSDMPVFILNSGFVAGPWEFVSYTLKHHNVAAIIGEDTMGIALMKTSVSISQHTDLVLNVAELTHPNTHENWKNIGVIADYQISAQNSFDLALELALKNQNVGK